MAEPERRRRRPAISCTLCRRRKLRCNRELPCSNCLRSKNASCVFENHVPQAPRQRPLDAQTAGTGLARGLQTSPSSPPHESSSTTSRGSTIPSFPPMSVVRDSSTASTPGSLSSAQEAESLKARIRRLEEQLAAAGQTPAAPSAPTSRSINVIETGTSALAGTFHIHHSRLRSDSQYSISRSVLHKKRLFGQSHWINGVILVRDIFEAIEPHVRGEASKASAGMKRCKYLARVIKAQRTPSWPAAPTADLPAKEIADKLVDCYLRSIETFYRILHVPSFRRDYDALWTPGSEPDRGFLVQVKLVLAIGATVYDDDFSLRASAIRWVYEAQTWCADPRFKSQLSVQLLQTNILLLIGRETASVGEDSVWVAVGSLVRMAMHMGLHRDPTFLPKKTLLVAEMHRRLWLTILEISLQLSMSFGGPPFLSFEDFDTIPPGNYDDEQLSEENPSPQPDSVFTAMSTAIALHRTFSTRLAVAKLLNTLGPGSTYQETLRLDAELRAAYKTLSHALRRYPAENGPGPSQFQIRMVDFIMCRYLACLHIPFFGIALKEATYAYSRKVVVENSLRTWRVVCPSSALAASGLPEAALSPYERDIARLTASGAGFIRFAAIQTGLLIAVELKVQLQEDSSLSPVSVRPDLLAVLYETRSWCLKCIEIGETNIKGYLLSCMLTMQIEGLMQKIDDEEMARRLVGAAEGAEETCLAILEEKASQGHAERTLDGVGSMSLSTPSDLIEGWDFMMTDSQFEFGKMEPLNWLYNA